MSKQRLNFLKERSLEILLANQYPSGAFIACPSFSTYGYSWFRDGVYIAYALLLQGETEAARNFIDWGCRVVLDQGEKITTVVKHLEEGKKPLPSEFLGARYTLEGEEDRSDWPNFQIDGFGSWLWLTAEFVQRTGIDLPGPWKDAAERLWVYLSHVWRLPNNDCWEEFSDGIHPATLACVAGGIRVMAPRLEREGAGALAGEIEAYLRESSAPLGYYPKTLGGDAVDASLIWLAVPYGVVNPGEPEMVRTIEEIEKNLLVEGGVKRYGKDSYYGGGRWILLSAFLGWYYLKVGRIKEAAILREWIAAQSTEDGQLPEQVNDLVNDPSMIQPWVQRWGAVATPSFGPTPCS